MSQTPIIVTADPAFVLEPIDDNTGCKMLKDLKISLTEQHPRIGISVRPWNLNKSRKIIAEACDYLVKSHNADIIFLPMHIEDYHESIEIVKLMKENQDYSRINGST